MPEFLGGKWGSEPFGTPGGTLTWSIVEEGNLSFSQGNVHGARGPTKNAAEIFDYDVVKTLTQAFQVWSEAANIDFIQVPDGGGSTFIGNQGDLRIAFVTIPGEILGFARGPSDQSPFAGNIVLRANGAAHRVLDKEDPDIGKFLFTTTVHEIGHAIGLDHSTKNISVMRPAGSSTFNGELQADDIQGIQQLYGQQVDNEIRYVLAQDQRSFDTISILDTMIIGTVKSENIKAGNGDDKITSMGGNDVIFSRNGNDTINGGSGNDRLKGGNGNDLLVGGKGVDTLKGNGGDDNIKGNGGADIIRGGGGDDTVKGGGGNDLIFGGGGNDTLKGNGGDDTLKGNSGADVFQFRTSDRSDTIIDFHHGQDKIHIQNGVGTFEDLDIKQDGFDVLIGFGAGQVRVVTDTALAFDEGDFIF